MESLYVRPAEGRKVRMPERGQAVMPTEGAEVPRTPFWVRRLNTGDVIEAKAPKRPKGQEE